MLRVVTLGQAEIIGRAAGARGGGALYPSGAVEKPCGARSGAEGLPQSSFGTIRGYAQGAERKALKTQALKEFVPARRTGRARGMLL